MFLGPVYGSDGSYDPGSQHQRGAPILCTEFGGVKIASGSDELQSEVWGYTTAQDSQDLLKRVENVMMATVRSGVVCGVVWTQL